METMAATLFDKQYILKQVLCNTHRTQSVQGVCSMNILSISNAIANGFKPAWDYP